MRVNSSSPRTVARRLFWAIKLLRWLQHYGHTISSIALSGGAIPTSGGVTLDNAYAYLGASDGNVHRLNLGSGTDDVQISPGITPDFVAVLP